MSRSPHNIWYQDKMNGIRRDWYQLDLAKYQYIVGVAGDRVCIYLQRQQPRVFV